MINDTKFLGLFLFSLSVVALCASISTSRVAVAACHDNVLDTRVADGTLSAAVTARPGSSAAVRATMKRDATLSLS